MGLNVPCCSALLLVVLAACNEGPMRAQPSTTAVTVTVTSVASPTTTASASTTTTASTTASLPEISRVELSLAEIPNHDPQTIVVQTFGVGSGPSELGVEDPVGEGITLRPTGPTPMGETIVIADQINSRWMLVEGSTVRSVAGPGGLIGTVAGLNDEVFVTGFDQGPVQVYQPLSTRPDVPVRSIEQLTNVVTSDGCRVSAWSPPDVRRDIAIADPSCPVVDDVLAPRSLLAVSRTDSEGTTEWLVEGEVYFSPLLSQPTADGVVLLTLGQDPNATGYVLLHLGSDGTAHRCTVPGDGVLFAEGVGPPNMALTPDGALLRLYRPTADAPIELRRIVCPK